MNPFLLFVLLGTAGWYTANAQPTLHVWVSNGPYYQGLPVVVHAVLAQHEGPVQYFLNGRQMKSEGFAAQDTLIPNSITRQGSVCDRSTSNFPLEVRADYGQGQVAIWRDTLVCQTLMLTVRRLPKDGPIKITPSIFRHCENYLALSGLPGNNFHPYFLWNVKGGNALLVSGENRLILQPDSDTLSFIVAGRLEDDLVPIDTLIFQSHPSPEPELRCRQCPIQPGEREVFWLVPDASLAVLCPQDARYQADSAFIGYEWPGNNNIIKTKQLEINSGVGTLVIYEWPNAPASPPGHSPVLVVYAHRIDYQNNIHPLPNPLLFWLDE